MIIPRHPHERFWDKVRVGNPDECWEWQGAVESFGYGFMWAGPLYPYRKRHWIKAHRVSWEIHNGEIPKGRYVLHKCDNPPCVNPNHLYIGTATENVHDRARRKRGKEHRQQGAANDNSKLTEADVRAIIVELQKLPRQSQSSIAEKFGIKQPQVSRIMLKQTWKHLWHE